ncbi:MAG: hypothetical protein MI861_03265 [Pirellulales bacterium]|nr:hypothetical protein [Pirellulales bacterium]
MRKFTSFFLLPCFILAAGWLALARAEETRAEETKSNRGTASKSDSSSRQSAPPAEGKLIVHEWGTFTTFSGSDGVFLDFRPLAAEHSDLPGFVFDRASASGGIFVSKRRLRGRVRMETPVTYFYTDRIRDVKVSVDFPEGLLTEFYPPVEKMLPVFNEQVAFKQGEPLGNSRLDWGTVTLIPTSELVPSIEDQKQRQRVANHIVNQVLPTGRNHQHYAQARATDSALVHVHNNFGPTIGGTPINAPQSYLEKFLFYRGVGDFQLPYRTEFRDGQIVMCNQGHLPINSAILIQVNGDKIATASIDRLDAEQSLAFGSPQPVDQTQLSQLVQDALVAEGLYKKEAASMVETWKQSWFTEEGTRVLYMVPGQLTDELLPLHVEPRPQETLRVLVGRMEVMSPEKEQQWLKAVARSAQLREQFLARIKGVKDNKEQFQISAEITQFGRLAEPALVRVSKITNDAKLRREAELLIAQLRAS